MKEDYVPVNGTEDGTEGDIWEDLDLIKQNQRLRLYNTLLLLTSGLAVIASIFFSLTSALHEISIETCTARIQSWSPFLKDIEYVSQHMNNEFEHETYYRGPPTNRLEREWERLWNHDLIAIPPEYVYKMNKSSEDLWLEAPGGYAANIDVFHQLHCLNLVRQYTWKDYYDQYPQIVQKPTDMTRAENDEAIRTHVDHCIETLRLTLMCHGDVTPYLHAKQSVHDTFATADFNMNHRCANFDKIVDAFEKRAVRERYPGTPSRQYESLAD